MILMVNGQQQSVSTPTDSLTRAVIISLFTWRRADPDDDSEQPMGWWGDSYPTIQNDRIGSRLYLLQRTTLTSKTVELARGYLDQALAWLKDDGVVSRIAINVQRRGTEILTAEITLYRNDGSSQLITFDDLWSALNG
ncbi:TPA: phage GP46 family protein [Yersinia enterocolitica]|uniref:phage GP46 family protein n=1 Tax=Yersinia enterocolitica TaxID=630 RepID=UPI0005E2449B|nr:phage GP46 family protein [Yersinia enterocolitica]CNF83266.1 GP46 family protein [Yersinia enterocolitica]HDL6967031.1 phage GP46 family protein [Yersinia enterocolitica]HDL6975118.1 phage GP46 family protein [Yersinia enterocolitica]HDL6996418.1 phage GP46 family protein [Yersinia enterocolitica]HDL7095405.1 phage GP46 family protein [Yersinia enterocolitica]